MLSRKTHRETMRWLDVTRRILEHAGHLSAADQLAVLSWLDAAEATAMNIAVIALLADGLVEIASIADDGPRLRLTRAGRARAGALLVEHPDEAQRILASLSAGDECNN